MSIVGLLTLVGLARDVSLRRRRPRFGSRRWQSAAAIPLLAALMGLPHVRDAAAAGTFYVDAASGGCSDAGPGTTTTPYCTINAAITARGGAGTTLLVKPGVYREDVSVTSSGSSGSPFIIQAVGSVVVDGADNFSSTTKWVQVSGNVWLASSVTWSPKQVFLDGARLTPVGGGSMSKLQARTYRYSSGSGLYVNAGGGNPGARQIFVGRRTSGFRVAGRSWVTIDGFAVTRTEDRAINLSSSANNVTLKNNTVTFARSYGIAISGSVGLLIRSNVVSDDNDHGIYLSSVTGSTLEDNESFRNAKPSNGVASGIFCTGASSNLLQRNRIHDNQDAGILLQSGSNNNTLLQNQSWNNTDCGYDHVSSIGARHVNNVAYGNLRDGFLFQTTSTGAALTNCIAVNNGTTTGAFDLSVDAGSATGYIANDNIFWNSNGQAPIKYAGGSYATIAAFTSAIGHDSRSIQADPRFVNGASGDFHLASGSPAIDNANTAAVSWPANDAAGLARVDDPTVPNTGQGTIPYADRGAYEYNPPDWPPVVTAPVSVSGSENALITFTLTVADADTDAVASLTATGLPPGAQFQAGADNASGTFSWTPSFNDGRATPYNVTFTAANALSGSATTAIWVDNVDRAPVVTAPIALSGTEDSSISFTVTASDPDEQTIGSLGASGLPPGAQFQAGPGNTSGTFSWTPSFTDARPLPYVITINASNALSGAASAAITVQNVDRAPLVSARASAVIVAGTPLSIPVTASDPDGDPIFSLAADLSALSPGSASFVEDASHASGSLTWTPTEIDVRAAPYPVSFTASNDLLGTTTTAISVRLVDLAPVVTVPAASAAAENSAVTVLVTAADPEGDPIDSLGVDLSGLPAGNNATFVTNPSRTAGTLTWTPTFNDSRAVPYPVLFTASNWISGSSNTAISVANTNRPPIAALTVSPATGSAPLVVTADASTSSDLDGPIVSYRFDFGDGATAGPQASAIATHTYTAGSWTVSVTVADADGATTVASKVVTVVFSQPPVASFFVAPTTRHPSFITLVTDSLLNVSEPLAPRPSYLVRTTDSTFKTPVTRITANAGTSLTVPGESGTWGADARHHYSKDQPWSSDGSLIEIQNPDGSPTHVYLDGETYQPRYGRCGNYDYGDDRWHPSRLHPRERINAHNNELWWFDVTTCTRTRNWILPFVVDGIGNGEGNPSWDGRFVALSDGRRVFVVDMDPQPPFAPYPNKRIGPVFDFSNCGLPDTCGIGWVSISPSGKYVVVKYDGDHPRVLNVDANTLALTPRPMPTSSPRCSGGDPVQGFIYDLGHADLTQNPFDNNEDVLIGQEHCGNRGATVGGQKIGSVVMARLRDGAITSLTDPTNEAYAHHVSTRNTARPGWAYVGYNYEPGKRFSDEIVAVKLDGRKSVQRFAHRRSADAGCYRCEAHAVPSPDGRRVMWASNWAQNCSVCGAATEIKAYVADARIPTRGDTLGRAPLSVTVDASASGDPDGNIVSYVFDFGDGAVTGPQPGPTATHTYAPGSWLVRVTVTDDQGRATSTLARYTVAPPNQAPNGTINTPVANVTIMAGQSVSFTASASDPDNDTPFTYLWNFGGGATNRSVEDPGNVTFNTAGTYVVTFTVKEAMGVSDPTPDSRVITVVPVPFHDGIHWTFTSSTSVTFDWRGTVNTLRYGLTSAYGQTVTGVTPSPLPVSSNGPFWEARITGLQENTLYHYSIGTGEDHTFRTPPVRGSTDFTVYVEGDIGASTSYTRVTGVQSLIAADMPAFVLALGDLTYANEKGMAAVDQHFNDMMVWSQDAAYMPVWGNHELSAPDDLRNYKGRFELPNPQTSPGAPSLGCCGEDWSWFDYGNVRFIAYPEPYSGAWADWNVKAAALMDAAQADPTIRFIVTFGHRPAYTSGEYTPGDLTLRSYLDALGVSHSKYTLDLNAHSHNYERTHPQNGVTHVTVGVGGATLEQESGACLWRGGCPPPPWSAMRAMHHGALKLRFTASTIEGHMICGPAGDSDSNRNDVTCVPGSDMDMFQIGVPWDREPVANAPGAVATVPNQALVVNVSATDPDGDAIASLTADLSGLPIGATFLSSGSSGTLTWTPTDADVRSTPYTVTFTAANALSSWTTTAITVSRAPVVTAPASVSGSEGSPISIPIAATDPDIESISALTADLSGLPAGSNAVFTEDATHASGTLTWTPTHDDARATPYTVSFTASNLLSGSATTSITVTAMDRAPAVTAPDTVIAVVNVPLALNVSAIDPDGDALESLTADLSSLPAGASFVAGSSWATGTFTWTPSSADLRADPYPVSFTAANALSGGAITNIRVTYINQPPQAVLAVSPSSGNAPLLVTANASSSTDDSVVASYRFDFGDGVVVGPQASPVATHTYPAGTWAATVTVTDNLGASATSSAVSVVVANPNLVTNPSFETSTTGWDVNGGSTIARVPGGYVGAYSLEMRGPASTASFGANDSPNWVGSAPAIGTRYRYSAWVRSAANVGAAKLKIREYLAGIQKGVTTYSPTVTLSPAWQMITADYVTTTAGTTLDFQVIDSPVTLNEVFQVDNVSVEIVPAPSAMNTMAAEGTNRTDVTVPGDRGMRPFRVSVVPNPIQGQATLHFTISRPGMVRAELIDLEGRRVRKLMEGAYVPAGSHQLALDGRNDQGEMLPAGVYFYRLHAPEGRVTGRLGFVR